jgi:hypothetical protein
MRLKHSGDIYFPSIALLKGFYMLVAFCVVITSGSVLSFYTNRWISAEAFLKHYIISSNFGLFLVSFHSCFQSKQIKSQEIWANLEQVSGNIAMRFLWYPYAQWGGSQIYLIASWFLRNPLKFKGNSIPRKSWILGSTQNSWILIEPKNLNTLGSLE